MTDRPVVLRVLDVYGPDGDGVDIGTVFVVTAIEDGHLVLENEILPPACDCDGGEQGEGLLSIAHEPGCASLRGGLPDDEIWRRHRAALEDEIKRRRDR